MARRESVLWRQAGGWVPARASELVVQDDLGPATWIAPLLAEGSYQVRDIAPQGFEAYARIFFPFVGEDSVRRVPWAQVPLARIQPTPSRMKVSWVEPSRVNNS